MTEGWLGLLGHIIRAAGHRGRATALTIAASASAGLPAVAGDWTISPSVSVATTFTDNANSATDREDRDSDYILSATPAISVAGRGGRLSVNLNYSHSQFLSGLGATDDSATDSLAANGRAELYDRVVFLDATTSISRQVVDSAQQVSTVDTGSDTNRTTVMTARAEPFFLHHFGTWLETETRSTFGLTRSRADEISDTKTLGESFTFNSGRRFSILTFSGGFEKTRISRDDDNPRTIETTADTSFRLRVHRKVSLLSSIGWENIDDPTLTDPPKGVTWSVGVSTQPSSRSSFEMTYGREFQTQSVSMAANYLLSSRSSISASYSESITTSQQILNDALDFIVDDGTGTLIDSRTGEVYDPNNPNFDFQNSLFRRKLFSLSVNATRRRTSYAGGFSWERRKTDTTGITETVTSVDMSASRTINRRLSGTLTASYVNQDFGTTDERRDHTVSLAAFLTYALMKNTNARLTYSRRDTRSSEGVNNFNDNTVTLSLTRTF